MVAEGFIIGLLGCLINKKNVHFKKVVARDTDKQKNNRKNRLKQPKAANFHSLHHQGNQPRNPIL